ncbi:hypothetical protein PAAG_11116 [Paracoccidioides lutzii Pb01]|uniref:Uncharacterized protein n=1 Tax=Paracoccidioides lutzii (strain ATCC MYA-826 / Pb01) TaxID=502779 RepID=A0A0A2V343_PARBA|nr:hypothetical protein PAAG_11116 [Paracoccidioides lutzii Pb01]KGQ02161.1 hypothetical protein PAAG_11116 [Paracoccidioides lutzii Pb01]
MALGPHANRDTRRSEGTEIPLQKFHAKYHTQQAEEFPSSRVSTRIRSKLTILDTYAICFITNFPVGNRASEIRAGRDESTSWAVQIQSQILSVEKLSRAIMESSAKQFEMARFDAGKENMFLVAALRILVMT